MKRQVNTNVSFNTHVTDVNNNNALTSSRVIQNYVISSDEDDDYNFDGEDDDEIRTWDLDEKLKNTHYNSEFLNFLDGKDVDIKYFEDNNFQYPIVFKSREDLGLKVPSDVITIHDVKRLVGGGKRVIDVMDVNTQQGFTMSMKDWCLYYENKKQRDRLLNVISLEFSHTRLDKFVEAPSIVRKIDWVPFAWPRTLLDAHTEATNLMEKMKYPKVQKYVLMSVADCYTDFHIDMGGTSVWYHVLKGEKVFWLIPPSEENLNLYVKWVKSGQQNKKFFADLVPNCQRVTLYQGWTFMLPSGWIHAVYTPKDSLVFGGNFLHSYSIPMQLKIYEIEKRTKVPEKFQYPFFIEHLWYVIENYVYQMTGISHLNEELCREAPKAYQIKATEHEGLSVLNRFIVMVKKRVPHTITKPDDLLKRFERILNPIVFTIIKSPSMANNLNDPKMVIYKTSPKRVDAVKQAAEKESLLNSLIFKPATDVVTRKYNMRNIQRTKGSIKKRLRSQHQLLQSNIERRRRIRCRTCEPCVRDDCGDCKYCKDMKKFGGQGVSKQCCLKKQCINPLLPSTTTCMCCGEQIDRFDSDTNTMMYECESCFEIYHAQCFWKQYSDLIDLECVINEALPSSWHCAKCIKNGFSVVNSNNNTNYHYDEDDMSSGNYDEDEYDGDEHVIQYEEEEEEEHNSSSSSLPQISLLLLTNEEKSIILTEFCEILPEYSQHNRTIFNEIDDDYDYLSDQNVNIFEDLETLNSSSNNNNTDNAVPAAAAAASTLSPTFAPPKLTNSHLNNLFSKQEFGTIIKSVRKRRKIINLKFNKIDIGNEDALRDDRDSNNNKLKEFLSLSRSSSSHYTHQQQQHHHHHHRSSYISTDDSLSFTMNYNNNNKKKNRNEEFEENTNNTDDANSESSLLWKPCI